MAVQHVDFGQHPETLFGQFLGDFVTGFDKVQAHAFAEAEGAVHQCFSFIAALASGLQNSSCNKRMTRSAGPGQIE